MLLTKERQHTAFQALKGAFHYRNLFQSPRLTKVVVSVGVGRQRDKDRLKLIVDRLSKITGQRPAPRGAKKSIASFKVREGETVGYQVTLRGKHMYDFIDKLVHVALPRTKDFRGLSPDSIDAMGNFTVGIREHTIFPETSDEDLRDVFGLAVTVVTTGKRKEEVVALLLHLGFPLQKK